MKKIALLALVTLFGCSQSDQQLSDCEQFCRDNQAEKCYDSSGDDFTPGDTDGEAGCGASIQECIDNCQKDNPKNK